MSIHTFVRERGARWALFALGSLLALGLLALAALAAVLHTFSARPGEWSHPLRLGPPGLRLTHAVSVPALLRLATHPIGLALLDGRSTDTPLGRWTWRRVGPDRLAGHCSPCVLPLAALGPLPLRLPRAELQVQRPAPDRYVGTLRLGDGAQALPLKWRATLSPTGLAVDADLPDTALAEAYAVFGPEAIPELRRARILGRVAARLSLALPERRLLVKPRLSGFEVDGLGTAALLNAEPALACAAGPAPPGERVIGWLPRAVVAAEDQRFAEHGGYDLPQLLAAWSANQPPAGAPAERVQGASTLTQQLAKLVYTGDERSAVRKLRELLYAVEMERTLGKGRILQLYLQIAPWGPGVCGAEAAARHYLRKPAAKLTPLEAAWLASLLREPVVPGAHGIDVERVGWVLGSLRGPLSAERRAEQLEALRGGWTPPAPRAASALRQP